MTFPQCIQVFLFKRSRTQSPTVAPRLSGSLARCHGQFRFTLPRNREDVVADLERSRLYRLSQLYEGLVKFQPDRLPSPPGQEADDVLLSIYNLLKEMLIISDAHNWGLGRGAAFLKTPPGCLCGSVAKRLMDPAFTAFLDHWLGVLGKYFAVYMVCY